LQAAAGDYGCGGRCRRFGEKRGKGFAARKTFAKDVVAGVAASATTPYVLGALRYAKKLGATTIGVAANRVGPLMKLAKIFVAPEVGPEV